MHNIHAFNYYFCEVLVQCLLDESELCGEQSLDTAGQAQLQPFRLRPVLGAAQAFLTKSIFVKGILFGGLLTDGS